jgi:hypothetical protein
MTDRIDLGLKDTSAGCSCCSTSTASTAASATTAELTEDILVSGMTCAHCVAEASAEGGEVAAEKIREANDAIARLVRS